MSIFVVVEKNFVMFAPALERLKDITRNDLHIFLSDHCFETVYNSQGILSQPDFDPTLLFVTLEIGMGRVWLHLKYMKDPTIYSTIYPLTNK